jgi:hypothetical protein
MISLPFATLHYTRRSARRHTRPAFFESFEPRVLLSSTYLPSDLTGTLVLAGINRSGSLTATGAGVFSDGWITDQNSNLANLAGGSIYTMASDGSLTATIVANPLDSSPTVSIDLAGMINSGRDVIAFNEMNGNLPVLNGLDLLVSQGENGFFTQPDFAGTWRIAGDKFRGAISINAAGRVTGGNLTLQATGASARVTGGTAPLDNDGGGLLTLRTTFRGANAAFATLSLNFAMNQSKDFVAVQNSALGQSGDGGMGLMATLFKSSGGHKRTDISNQTWNIAAAQGAGSITFTSAGGLAGTLLYADGSTASLSGKYSVGSSGAVSLNITATGGSAGTSRFTLSGALNTADNIIGLNQTTKGTQSAFTVLTSAANHPPTQAAKALFPQAAHIANPLTMSFSDLQTALKVSDPDGDPVSLLITTVPANSGTLVINHNDDTTTVDPGTTVMVDGDTLTWTPATTAKGKVNAFSVQATDGEALALKTSPVYVATLPIPSVSIKVSRAKALESKAGSASANALFTISRSGNTSTDLTVSLSISGTAVADTNYNLVDSQGNTLSGDTATITIPARKSSVLLSVVPVQDNTADPTLTVQVQIIPDPNTSAPNYIPTVKNTATVSIIDFTPTTASSLA